MQTHDHNKPQVEHPYSVEYRRGWIGDPKMVNALSIISFVSGMLVYFRYVVQLIFFLDSRSLVVIVLPFVSLFFALIAVAIGFVAMHQHGSFKHPEYSGGKLAGTGIWLGAAWLLFAYLALLFGF